MEGRNFLRTYSMKCGAMGSSGFEIGNMSSPAETPLHISFSVEKSDAEAANTAKVQIWNLSDQNLKVLDTADCVLELKAGYGNNNALILVGNITHASTSMDGADRMTELEVVDGRVELRDCVLSISFDGAVDSREVYSYIAGQMGVAILFADGLEYKVLPNGFSFVGQARTALQKIAECCGHVWTMQNQILQITFPGHPVAAVGYVLNSNTGLIGTPKRIVIGSNKENEKALTGCEVEYLLNGAIGINDTVQLESSIASGYFRVHKVTFDGDNMEGDWICTAQLLEIAAESERI